MGRQGAALFAVALVAFALFALSMGSSPASAASVTATATFSIAQSSDDCYEISDATIDLLDGILIVGKPNGTAIYDAGMRFTGASIPKDAQIINAYVTLTCYAHGRGAGVRTVFRGLEVPSVYTFSAANRPSLMAKTAANVGWDLGAWNSNAKYSSPNLAGIVQEIVDQPGWVTGNPIGIAWEDDGTPAWVARNVFSGDYWTGKSKAPVLTVVYTYGTDSTPPIVTLTGPEAGARLTGVVPVTATASDDAGVARVDFYADSNLIGSDATAPFAAAWDTSLYASGPHNVRAVAVDTAGNSATSLVSVTVDRSGPAISNIAVSGIGTHAATITWTTDEPATSQIDYGTTASYGSQTPLDSTLTTSHSVSVTGLDESTIYHLRVLSTDSLGNTSASSDSVFSTLDVTAPTVSLTAPTVGARVTGDVPVTALASDDVAVTRVDFYADSILIGSDTSAPYAAVWNTALYVDGAHTLRAVALDGAGNAANSTVSVVVDHTAPTISEATVSAIGTDTATITWATDEPATTQVEYGTSVSYGSQSPLGSALTTAHSVTLVGLASDATFHFRARSADSLGNLGNSGDATFKTLFAPDTVAPHVALTAPASGAVVNGDVVLAATASDDRGVTQVEFYVDSTSIGIDSSQPFAATWDSSAYVEGPHSLRAVAYDAGGNAAVSTIAVTVDRSGPVISNVSVSGVAGGSATITWTTNEPSTSRVEYGATTSYGSLTSLDPALTTSHSVTITGLTSSSTYHARALSTDSAGNQSASSDVVFTAPDVIAPTVTLTAPAPGSRVTGMVALAATALDDVGVAEVAFYVGSNLVVADGTAPYGTTWDSTLASEGVKSIHAVARDAAGNAATSTVSVTVDRTGPVVSDVSLTGVTRTSATVTWTTNEPATSRVEYGTTSAYGSQSALDSALTTSHSVTLTGLSSSTTYHYRVLSVDSVGNASASGDATFLALDVTAPTVSLTAPPSAARVNGVVAIAADASDDVGVTQVDFYTDSTLIGSDSATPYSASLDTGLYPEGAHTVRAVARDASGNAATATVSVTIDRSGPAISAVSVTAVGKDAATISWTTSEPATTRVEYGTATSYGSQTPLDSALTTSHSVTITGLTASTTYHFRVLSADAIGNSSASADGTLTTTSGQPITATITVPINRPTDDGTEFGDSTIDLANAYVEVGRGNGTQSSDVGMRFASASIPQGAKITEAHVTVSSWGFGLGSGVKTVFKGLKTPSPATFSATNRPSQIAKTSATVAWDLAAWTADTKYNSPNLAAIVQELIDQSGWAQGNPVAIVWEDNGTAAWSGRNVSAYEDGTQFTPVLSVTYTYDPGPDTTAPAVSLAAPVSGARVTGSVLVSATASDNRGVSQVDFYAGSTLLGSDAISPYTSSWDTQLYVDGAHTLRAVARDAAGNAATSTISVTVDNTPPKISGVSASAVTTLAATITWTTDEPSTSRVEYGQTDSYGSQSPLDSTLTTNHSVNLTGLTPDTAYHFRVLSSDAVGKAASSSDATFKTLYAPDVTPPTVNLTAPLGGARVTGVVNVTAEASDDRRVTQVEFYADSTLLNTDVSAPYAAAWDTSVYATGAHTLRAVARDPEGNAGTATLAVTVDRTAPAISAVSALTAAEGAAISWTTDERATSRVEYGPTSAYGSQTPLDSTLVISHSVSVTGLAPDTLYHYRVLSTDEAGNSSVSADGTFRTTQGRDTTPPNLSITAPADGSIVSGSVGISATAADGSGVSKVEFRVNGRLVATDAGAPYAATWSAPSVFTTGPVVSFTFDDTDRTQYTNFYPVLAAQGWPGTAYIITERVDLSDYWMSVADMRDLRDHGWEISSHTTDHWENTGYWETADYETPVAQAKAFLDANGFPNSGFAAPYGVYNDRAVAAVKKYHPYYRDYDDGWPTPARYNNVPVSDPYDIDTTYLAEGTSNLTYLRSMLNSAVTNHKWVVVLCHGWEDPTDWFTTVVNEVKSRNIPVATVRDVLGGPYTIEVKAYDTAGNVSTKSVTVRTRP